MINNVFSKMFKKITSKHFKSQFAIQGCGSAFIQCGSGSSHFFNADPAFKNCGVNFLTDIFVYLKGSNDLTSANNSQLFTEFRLRINYFV